MTLTVTPPPDNIHPVFLRLHIDRVPAAPVDSAECGVTTYARELAQSLQATLRGETWQAATRTRAMPHPRIDGISNVMITIDRRHLISTAHRTTAATMRDTWRIRYNGRPIPHRTFPGEVPHQVPAISRSVWRHINGVRTEPCDTLGCTAPAVVATYRHVSLCTSCDRRYTQNGQ